MICSLMTDLQMCMQDYVDYSARAYRHILILAENLLKDYGDVYQSVHNVLKQTEPIKKREMNSTMHFPLFCVLLIQYSIS